MIHNLIWHPNMSLEDAEKVVVREAFKFFGGNKTRTSQALRIDAKTLDSILDRIDGKKPEDYGIEAPIPRKKRKNEDKAS